MVSHSERYVKDCIASCERFQRRIGATYDRRDVQQLPETENGAHDASACFDHNDP